MPAMSLTEGEYYVALVVDSGSAITEVSEANNIVRTASFEMLTELVGSEELLVTLARAVLMGRGTLRRTIYISTVLWPMCNEECLVYRREPAEFLQLKNS